MQLPQEIEYWYILPALRKEIVLELKKREFSQKKIAELMSISDAAVSQYLSKKRASEIEFDDNFKKRIKKSVDKIEKNPKEVNAQLCFLMKIIRVSRILCMVHKKKGAPEDCNICFPRVM